MSNPRWEYTIWIPAAGASHEAVLNSFGAEGWELVAATTGHVDHNLQSCAPRFYFKRRRASKAKAAGKAEPPPRTAATGEAGIPNRFHPDGTPDDAAASTGKETG